MRGAALSLALFLLFHSYLVGFSEAQTSQGQTKSIPELVEELKKEVKELQEWQRNHSLEHKTSGFQTEKKEMQLADLKAALKTKDENKRRVALRSALASDNLDLQHVALVEIFSTTKVFAGESKIQWAGKPTTYALKLRIDKFEKETGRFTGELDVSTFFVKFNAGRTIEKIQGSLTGNRVGGTTEHCGLRLSLTKNSYMEGSLDCRKNGTVTIFIF